MEIQEMLMRMFFGGTLVGTMIGMSIMCIITLIALKIKERFETDD